MYSYEVLLQYRKRVLSIDRSYTYLPADVCQRTQRCNRRQALPRPVRTCTCVYLVQVCTCTTGIVCISTRQKEGACGTFSYMLSCLPSSVVGVYTSCTHMVCGHALLHIKHDRAVSSLYKSQRDRTISYPSSDIYHAFAY